MDSSRLYTKPSNVFNIWYKELCRRRNCSPLILMQPDNNTVLELEADRFKLQELILIINALHSDTSLHTIIIKSKLKNCSFLHDVDTAEKASHVKRRFGPLWTAYLLGELTKSISSSLRNTQVLSFLELDGLPLFAKYLEPMLKALKKNKSVKHLSFANCAIKDEGCELLCKYLRYSTNIEVLNLSGCQLTSRSGQYLAELIKYQQINRYSENYYYSQRYEDRQQHSVKGIKRVTLNRNYDLHDRGLKCILDELEDDLWIKAIDIQDCGITNKLTQKIFETVHCNKSLEILDLRQNQHLNNTTVETISKLLIQKREIGFQPEFQWCDLAVDVAFCSKSSGTIKVCGKDFSDNDIKIEKEIQKEIQMQKGLERQIRGIKKLLKFYYCVYDCTLGDPDSPPSSEISSSKIIDLKKVPSLQRVNEKNPISTSIDFADNEGNTNKISFKEAEAVSAKNDGQNIAEVKEKMDKTEFSKENFELEAALCGSLNTSSSKPTSASKINTILSNDEAVVDSSNDLIEYLPKEASVYTENIDKAKDADEADDTEDAEEAEDAESAEDADAENSEEDSLSDSSADSVKTVLEFPLKNIQS